MILYIEKWTETEWIFTMDTFERQVLGYIKEYDMFGGVRHCVCGVSGGADSVSLLTVLARHRDELGLELHVIHINHMIRGDDADSDQHYVEALCEEYGVDCVSHNIDVQKMAADTGLTVEEAGRKARYDAFEQTRSRLSDEGCVIAVAHNRNDVAETVLFNMARGTGLGGVKGIVPVRDGIVRPLLSSDRTQIEAYLERNNIAYCTDATNNEDDYTRNRIRHRVLPELCQINGQAVEHICSMAQIASDYERLAEDMVYRFLKSQGIDRRKSECRWTGEDSGSQKYRVDMDSLKAEDKLVQELVIRQLVGMVSGGLKDIGKSHVREVMKLYNAESGAGIDLPGNGRVYVEYGQLVFAVACADETDRADTSEHCSSVELVYGLDKMYTAPGGQMRVRVYDRPAGLDLTKKEYTKYLDYDRIDKCLQLRTYEKGDRITVSADGASKKVNRLFTDAKVPADRRVRVPLVASGSDVIWVVGLRIGEGCKVTDSTRIIVELQYIREDNEEEQR